MAGIAQWLCRGRAAIQCAVLADGEGCRGMGRRMFVAAVLGRCWYHQSRRYFVDTNSAKSTNLGQRVAGLVVNAALAGAVWRCTAAENMLAAAASLSRSRKEPPPRSPSHLISSYRLLSNIHLRFLTTRTTYA